jgi:autotransporter-associated beta strand protein
LKQHRWDTGGWVLLALVGVGLGLARPANGQTLRIASYNLDSQDQSSDNNITQSTGATAHSLPTVIQGIGNHHIGTNAQMVDVLGMEEMMTSKTGSFNTTMTDMATQLNAIYGAGTYSFDQGTANSEQSQSEGLIYNTKTVQIVSVRILPTGSNVLLTSTGYTAANQVSGGQTVPRSPMLYQLRPVGYGSNADFYMYVSHARSTTDNSAGDARYMEAQEVRSDAKYNLPAGAHILYSGDFNLFNGSSENAYKCLTGQTTSDNKNWADNSSVWANANPTQGFDPTSGTSPATTTSWSNSTSDGTRTWLYTDSTNSGSFTTSSRLDIHLMNSPMLSAAGLQIAPDTSDPSDPRNFPSSQYPYAFEVFGNNGSTTRGTVVNNVNNTSLSDLANASTVLADLQLTGSGNTSTGSDHYPIVGDYRLTGISPLARTWTGGGGNGNWSTTADWDGIPVNLADLTFAGTLQTSTTNNSLSSVGAITFASGAGVFTLAGNALAIGGGITNNSTNSQTVSLNLTLSAAQQFNAASGNLIVSGTIATGGNTLTVTGSSNTTLSGAISGAGALIKSGNGTATLSASNSYGGGTTAGGGTLIVAHANALGSGPLTINSSAAVKLQAGLSAPVQLSALTIAGGTSPTATLDVTDNNMVLHNGDISTTVAQLKAGLNSSGALWTGNGIASSTAATNAAANSNATVFAVGAIKNIDKNNNLIYSTWPAAPSPDGGGVSGLTTTDVLVKYTYFGDADLNGVVDNTTDYDLWSNGFINPTLAATNGWLYGDFDFSGIVDNTTDYDLWSTGFVHQGSALVGAPAAQTATTDLQTVPEPSGLILAMAGLSGIVVLARRVSNLKT